MGAPEFRFDPESHTYWLGGVQIDGVTSMLKGMEDLSSIPPAILARKAELGTAVHYATELDDQGQLDEDTVHEEVLGYLNGWRLFKREHEVEFISIEQKLAHRRMRYAGTVDRVMKVDSERGVWDIKTRLEIPPVVGIQLAAYNELVPEFEALLACNGNDFNRFYAEVKRLAALPKSLRRAQLTSTSTTSGS